VMYLVDTNVLSAGAPTSAGSMLGLVDWMDVNSQRLFLSIVTVVEVEDGIAKSLREGASRKAGRLAEWLETLLHLYSARILPLDVSIARVAGKLADQARGSGHAPGFADIVIAATARSRGYTVLTRNVRHFRALDVLVHDPFEGLPVA
jgi:predicted nucleic acid-binding protein